MFFYPKILSIVVNNGRVQKSENAQYHDEEVAMNSDESQRRVDQSDQRSLST